MRILFLVFLILFSLNGYSQNYGSLPKIEQDKLLRDFELLKQALEKYHTGLYWYTPKEVYDEAFEKARAQIKGPMNVFEFHKLIAGLIVLCREDHTNIFLPQSAKSHMEEHISFLPMRLIFLGTDLYCLADGSEAKEDLRGKKILSINGKKPTDLVLELGNMFASDAFITKVKFSDLSGFAFSRYYFLKYGEVDAFTLELAGENTPLTLAALPLEEINANLKKKALTNKPPSENEVLEFRTYEDKIAYLGVHSFANSSYDRNYKKFLKESFQQIEERGIKTLIIDMGQNGGGNEGNENLLYSYIGDNYQKYKAVNSKTHKLRLDNGVDKVISYKTYGIFERAFGVERQADGSYKRKEHRGHGLMAYKKEPAHKFKGKLYVIISPITYSGGSEFVNMVHSQDRGIFVGEETGGGYLGNTSGYSFELRLPHSAIEVDIPALQFVMNVKDMGQKPARGVLPDFEVIPSFEDILKRKNAALEFILEKEGVK
ncbi:MAG: S41 family peptidase [Bacteroidota bacterium]